MKKTLLSLATAAVLGLAGASASAEVMLDWKIDESKLPTAVPCTVDCVKTVDNMTGKYRELLGFDGAGGFSASAVGFFAGYFANEGNDGVDTKLAASTGSTAEGRYQIYAKFVASGTISGGVATGNSGKLEIWVDVDRNTKFDPTGTGGFADPTDFAQTTDGSDANDILLGSSSVSYGASGVGFGSIGNSFNIYFEQFTLTADGAKYWFDPKPFHVRVWSNGDMDTAFNPLTAGTANVVGDMSAVFIVPEPGSLALMGLALAGLGLVQRRRKAAL